MDLLTLALARGSGGGGGGEVTRAEFNALAAKVLWDDIFEYTNIIGPAKIGNTIIS